MRKATRRRQAKLGGRALNPQFTPKERQALYARERRQAQAQRLREIRRELRVETPAWLLEEIGASQSALRGENEPGLYQMLYEARRT